ncbi:MAG: YlbF family regulator [Desulforudis sp.]|jgi:cell fate (sporulation/competence/biofilm development) regulator YlbF (YheA/YmcA/DUF963 family)|nr:MAG: YlbF family regulator [Desulforudis sp.]
MPIIAKAMELGTEIANSGELKAFREAEAAVLANAEAYDLIRQYQNGQREIQEARAGGRVLSDEQQQDFQAMQEKLMANTVVKNYFESQQRFDQVIQTINQILQQAISGNSCSGSSGG